MLKWVKGQGDKVQIPVLGGVGNLIVGEAPEYLDDVSHGMRATTGAGMSTGLPVGAADTALLPVLGAATGALTRAGVRAGNRALKRGVEREMATPHNPSRRKALAQTRDAVVGGAAAAAAPKGLVDLLASAAPKAAAEAAPVLINPYSVMGDFVRKGVSFDLVDFRPLSHVAEDLAEDIANNPELAKRFPAEDDELASEVYQMVLDGEFDQLPEEMADYYGRRAVEVVEESKRGLAEMYSGPEGAQKYYDELIENGIDPNEAEEITQLMQSSFDDFHANEIELARIDQGLPANSTPITPEAPGVSRRDFLKSTGSSALPDVPVTPLLEAVTKAVPKASRQALTDREKLEMLSKYVADNPEYDVADHLASIEFNMDPEDVTEEFSERMWEQFTGGDFSDVADDEMVDYLEWVKDLVENIDEWKSTIDAEGMYKRGLQRLEKERAQGYDPLDQPVMEQVYADRMRRFDWDTFNEGRLPEVDPNAPIDPGRRETLKNVGGMAGAAALAHVAPKNLLDVLGSGTAPAAKAAVKMAPKAELDLFTDYLAKNFDFINDDYYGEFVHGVASQLNEIPGIRKVIPDPDDAHYIVEDMLDMTSARSGWLNGPEAVELPNEAIKLLRDEFENLVKLVDEEKPLSREWLDADGGLAWREMAQTTSPEDMKRYQDNIDTQFNWNELGKAGGPAREPTVGPRLKKLREEQLRGKVK
jgi:hypothetical protein